MDKNLRGRLITVLLGVPFVLGIIFLVPQYNFLAFSLLVIAIAFIGSLEMSRMLFSKHTVIAFLAPLLPVLQYILGLKEPESQLTDLLFVVLLLLSFMIEIKAGEKDGFKNSLDKAAKNALLVTYPSYFISFLLRFLALESITSYAVMMFFVLVFGNDIFEQMVSYKFQYPMGLNGTVELAFDVPSYADVDKEYQHALHHGAISVLPPTTEPWGQRTCYVADPDGNLIEIGSFTK